MQGCLLETVIGTTGSNLENANLEPKLIFTVAALSITWQILQCDILKEVPKDAAELLIIYSS